MADRHVDLQERREGDRVAARALDHVHGEVLDGRSRLVVPRALEPVERRRHRVADVGRETRPTTCRRCSAAGSAARSRAAASWRGCTRRPSTRTSATSPSRGRRPRSRGASTTARAASASSGTGASFRLESRIPGADVNPYLAYAATIAAGLHGIEHGHRAAAALRRQRVRGRPSCRACRRASSRRSTRSEQSKVARRRVRRRTCTTIC